MYSPWTKHKLRWFTLCLIWGILIVRTFIGSEIMEIRIPPSTYLGDFIHMRSYVEFFMTGKEYSQLQIDPKSFDANFAPVFPGLTLFFVPLVWMNRVTAEAISLILNIIFPFLTAYLVLRIMNLPFTWRLWTPSKEAFFTLIFLILFFFTRPYIISMPIGQISSPTFFFICYSIFFRSGIALGIATALKFSLTPFYFPLLILGKKYIEVIKSFVVLTLVLLFPIIYYPDLWDLYRDYIVKMREHFSVPNIDYYDGSGKHCLTLLDIGWFKLKAINILIKTFLFLLLFYGYWKSRNDNRLGVHTLVLIGAVTLITFYHRVQDEMLVTVPLLMVLITHYQKKEWKKGIFPAIIYSYFLLPGEYWYHCMLVAMRYFKGNSWFYPSFSQSLPIDSAICFILALFAFKRIYCEEEIYVQPLD
jgi:hypothetical protein